MKEIGYIYLSWRKGTSSKRHIVGRIRHNATDGVRFSYLLESIEDAEKEGFQPYGDFPDVAATYEDNVLEVFGQRLMRSEREDLGSFYDFWEIDRTFKEDKLYMLAHTQGFNPSDNFEFLADFNPTKDLVFVSDLAGLSALELKKDSVRVGQELTYKFQRGNSHDKNAVEVFSGNQTVGFIKQIHNHVFHKVTPGTLRITVKAVEQNGTMKRIFVRISMK